MPTHLDDDQVHHLVNGLSLEVRRQAERIRRRSHGRDWPGAASAMAELEETVELLSEFVTVSLRASMTRETQSESDGPVDVEPDPVPVGQYL